MSISTITNKDNLVVIPNNPSDAYQIGYAIGYQDGKRDAASPWHRVEDGLPRGQELVIVAVKDTAGDTPFWYTQCGWITTDGEYWIVDNEICDYVVAWMPLPEPPKEGNNESSRKEASSDL